MISLNGVELSKDLFWQNEFSEPKIMQQKQRVILGRSVMHTSPITGGREIILKATRNSSMIQGYFTKEQILGFRALEATGQIIILVYEAETIQVSIKAGGVNVIPHIERPNSSSSDMYSGTLTLLEV